MIEEPETTIIEKCAITDEYYSVTVKTKDLIRFENNEGTIQSIFPYLSSGDREFVKSRISPMGWKAIFPSG